MLTFQSPVLRACAPLLGLTALAASLVASTGVAHASRFGPPWQSQVVVPRTVVYAAPDGGSQPIGPLGKGAIVVVLAELTGTDGSAWTEIPDGYVRSADLAELITPWTAEVAVPRVSVYAKPNAQSPVRREAVEGDLLRVTGVAPGIDGDTDVWWATTEGYVHLRTIRWATNDWASLWQLPAASEAPGGWWGAITSTANVRTGPSLDAPIVGQLAPGDRVKVLSQEDGDAVGGNARWYRIDGGRFAGARVHSSLVARLPDPQPNTTPLPGGTPQGSWIVVDRTHSTLTLVNPDGTPAFVTYVSLGRAGVETQSGVYSTFGKFRADPMTSASVPGAEHSYYLPNVPFTQYFIEDGSAIHGTYWHDHFGLVESQGCVNLTWTDAAYLFNLTRPAVPAGANEQWSGKAEATQVLILD